MAFHSSTFSAGAVACGTPTKTAMESAARPAEAVSPNALVRWAFYLSIFAIPFNHLYLPGTGERMGVSRFVQLLMLCGVLYQPRVCLRLVPAALFWFLGYILLRIVWGFWLTPDQFDAWWPSSLWFIEQLPWLWIMFNVLQFPETRRGGLWALGLGCSFCALFHVAGIGVAEINDGFERRSAVFGLNPNEESGCYAIAMIVLLGIWMSRSTDWVQRWAPFLLLAVIGVATAETGSRSALLELGVGALVLLLLGKTFGSKTKRIIGLATLAAVLAVILWQIPTVMQRFGEINTQNIGSHNPRARMAPVLWEMFLRSPIYGLGPDSYEWELTRRAMPYLINQGRLIVSHNLALLLLVETGIIGFLVFSTGLGKSLAAAWRGRFGSCGAVPLAMLLPMVISGATVGNSTGQPIFWMVLAYALAIRSQGEQT